MALKRTRVPFYGKWASNTERTANVLDKLGKTEEAQEARDALKKNLEKRRGRKAGAK